MTLYECVFIARQELSVSQAEQLAEQMSGFITDNGGTMRSKEYWGLKNLAYRIKKNRKGHYTMFHIEAPSDAVREMERNMGLSEDILRYLIIRMEELPEGPSIMMQARVDRGDRARRDRPPRRDGPGAGRRDGPETPQPVSPQQEASPPAEADAEAAAPAEI